jgi:hypothetical protein
MLVDQQPASLGHDLIERQFKLGPTIATKAVKYVARQALGMDTNQQRPEFGAWIAEFESQGFFCLVLSNTFEAVYAKYSEAGWKVRLGDLIQLEVSGNDVTFYYRSRRCSTNNSWRRC